MKTKKTGNITRYECCPVCPVRATLLVLLFGMLLSACASISRPQSSGQQMKAAPVDAETITIKAPLKDENVLEKGWWQIGFHRPFKEDEELQWQYDTFIAHQILKPVIHTNQELALWRFHRRAAPDEAAHRFSFIFYATRKVGEDIYQKISQDETVRQLLDGEHLDRLSFYDINKELRSEMENTSDPRWPLELQKTWPYFMMGACQTWLGLVELYYDELALSKESDLNERLAGFEKVNEKLNLLWKKNGNHAFLHHLNALFAYQELYIAGGWLGRF